MRELVEMHYLLTTPVLMDDSALRGLLGSVHTDALCGGAAADSRCLPEGGGKGVGGSSWHPERGRGWPEGAGLWRSGDLWMRDKWRKGTRLFIVNKGIVVRS